ncbi:NAD(P)-binding protein [Nocardia sp. ET3-3]|uniref:NAD(P)-binding protein n=1 Tax=Nocardia terrae TaxID=2675851 RepID=A0A7K1US97_9NOCA|nr:NAD(P)/FAD-dependent oxidoreductase [Nocardia terrae]MVU77217.1 NAD(P)-binding protein [Nocardia terrae]
MKPPSQHHPQTEPDLEVVVIGAGFGGLGAAVELRRAGIDNFRILDKNADIGGTWYANTYPGVAVDIPSVYYSFSYAAPKTWTRLFAPGAEVKAYADQIADDYGLRDKLSLDTTVTGASWDEDNHCWWIETTETLLAARYLIVAVGGLEIPRMPELPGIDEFAGKVVHTARWDHEYDYRGRRIAVIGTGATALQLIPELAQDAGRLTVFQRTPIWVMPKPDFGVAPVVKRALDRVPGLRRLVRLAVMTSFDAGVSTAGVFYRFTNPTIRGSARILRRWYRTQVGDPVLRDRLTPDYTLGCKRPSVSNRYLRTFTEDHVELVTEPIEKITRTGVVTGSGTEHEIDVLVCATGFKVMEAGATPPFPIRGRAQELGEFWQANRFQAYQGVSIPDFPNLFMVTGPYGFAAASYIAMIECTTRHARRAITAARARAATAVEIRREPHERYWRKSLRRHRNALWLNNDCESSNTYYINGHHDVAAIRPSTHAGMWWGNKHFPLRHYSYSRLESRPDHAESAS